MDKAVLLLLAADSALRSAMRRWAHRHSAKVLRAIGETRAAEALELISAAGVPQPDPDYGETERTITGMPATRPPAKLHPFDQHLRSLPKLY